MSGLPSSLRVFVHFKDETVFAGEDVECTITFKNVGSTSRDSTPANNGGGAVLPGTARGAVVINQLRSNKSALCPGLGRTISTSSQSTARPASKNYPENTPTTPKTPNWNEAGQQSPSRIARQFPSPGKERKHGHTRSVSIMSIGSVKDSERPVIKSSKTNEDTQARRPPHTERASQSSFQSVYDLDSSQRPGPRTSGKNSPSQRSGASTPITSPDRPPNNASPSKQRKPSFAKAFQAPDVPRYPSSKTEDTSRRSSGAVGSPERVQVSPAQSPTDVVIKPGDIRPPKVRRAKQSIDLRLPEPVDARVFSIRGDDETPRPSVDIYNLGNPSDETLMSEAPFALDSRLRRTQSSRQSSFITVNRPPAMQRTETLMMGYVQVAGKFVLDGALVNRAPFEDVKRRAVVGGQAGGGVVGIKRSNGDGGLFGGLSWGNIGESIGDLLGGGQPSSMREMKDIADSDSIPLLTTPKSILFVDLKLAPGQSTSFSYKFAMPRGLPPSHSGRAIKVSYDILIGTQRPGAARAQAQQQISQVSIPFRLFGGVNGQGESLGHDLMSPYIILKEKAIIHPLDPSTPRPPIQDEVDASQSASQAADFQEYVSQLLASSGDSDHGLLSPSAEVVPQTPRTPMTPRPTSRDASHSSSPPSSTPSARALVDYAIRWAGLRHSAIYSPTTFNIARNAIPIAILKISRSALRLGDLLICILDFAKAKLPCYAVETTLESSERVDPSLAIRSSQSIERVTRRVWAKTADCTVGAERSAISFQIPAAGTPSFTTTGVGVEWCLRVEIVVGTQSKRDSQLHKQRSTSSATQADHTSPEGADEHEDTDADPLNGHHNDGGDSDIAAKKLPVVSNALLEVVEADERGALLAPKVRLHCESFEVVIPLRIFGAGGGTWNGGSGGGTITKEASEDGLAV